MRPKIVFVVQSAVHRQETLQQLVDVLAPHPVIVHHDFSQQPAFGVVADHVRFVDAPERTGWGVWSVCTAMLRSIALALETHDFDYLQMLTPVDLPIRPMAQFEAAVARDDHDVAIDLLPLDDDVVTFMSFAYRLHARFESLPYRLLWKLHEGFFRTPYPTVARGSLSLPHASAIRDNALGACARAATAAYARLDPLGRGTGGRWPLAVSGVWFGARRGACERLLALMADDTWRRRFQPLFSPDEALFATAFATTGLRIGPGNHLMSPFQGARPRDWTLDDLPALQADGRFFSRKFPDDPAAPVRLAVLRAVAPGRVP